MKEEEKDSQWPSTNVNTPKDETWGFSPSATTRLDAPSVYMIVLTGVLNRRVHLFNLTALLVAGAKEDLVD